MRSARLFWPLAITLVLVDCTTKLIALTLAVLGFLARNYAQLTRTGRLAIVGTALVTGGAIGNLLDRLVSSSGVIDFIDVGIGLHRFYVFNVADIGVTVGAVMLAYALSRPSRASIEVSP